MENSRHIEKCPPSYSVCTGCGSCEIICSLVHEGLASPSCNRVFVQQGPTHKLIFHVYTCQQCEEPTCYEACPLKDKAMTIDENGTVIINEEACIGCGKCQKACKYKPCRINLVNSKDRKKRKAKKCDLCKGRPEGPACVQWCPAKCLELNDKPLPWDTAEDRSGTTDGSANEGIQYRVAVEQSADIGVNAGTEKTGDAPDIKEAGGAQHG